MIFGKIEKNEKTVKFHLNLMCSKCQKTVPGGMKSSESYFNSKPFMIDLEIFKKNYLCGVCRDMKRITDKQ